MIVSFRLLKMHADDGTNLFLLLECARKLRRPFLRLLALRFLRGQPLAPFPFDVFAHRTQRCAQVVLVPFDDHLELADVACLFSEQAILLALWCVRGQLGPREERHFQRKDLRRLRFDLASCGKKLLLELGRSCMRVSFGGGAWEKRERGWMGRTAYLVRCHVKVNLGGTRWARLVPAVLIYCLAGEDKVRELLDARVEVFHRLALVQLLRILSIGTAGQ